MKKLTNNKEEINRKIQKCAEKHAPTHGRFSVEQVSKQLAQLHQRLQYKIKRCQKLRLSDWHNLELDTAPAEFSLEFDL